MSVKFDDFLQEQLQDPELKKEYEALQPEHAIIQAIIDARQKSGLTQRNCRNVPVLRRGISANWREEMPILLYGLYSALPQGWE